MSLFDHPGFAMIPIYRARGWLRKALRRPAKAAGMLPVWMGTREDAAELLAKTPSGPERTALKTSVFALMYGRQVTGETKAGPMVDPDVAAAAMARWESLKKLTEVYPLPKLDRDDFKGRPTTGWGVPKSCATGHHEDCPVSATWPCACFCHDGTNYGLRP